MANSETPSPEEPVDSEAVNPPGDLPDPAGSVTMADVPSVMQKKKFGVVSGSGRIELPGDLGTALSDLENLLEMPVWTVIHTGREPGPLDLDDVQSFLGVRDKLKAGEPVALVIDSPGGRADAAFKLARVLCRHAGGFRAIIPRYAKSAATLLALGASEVIMAHDAEIGPLDVQVYDEEREERGSALDEVQALEQLHQAALAQSVVNLRTLRRSTRKRTDVILPHAMQLAADTIAPLLEKIDTVHYAKQSRRLKVAEEYAVRLISAHRDIHTAVSVAWELVREYPEHGFVIDRKEAKEMIPIIDGPPGVDEVLRRIEVSLYDADTDACGRLEEIS